MDFNTCGVCGKKVEANPYLYDAFTCDECKTAIAEKEGSDGGSILHFVSTMTDKNVKIVMGVVSIIVAVLASLAIFKVRGIDCQPAGYIFLALPVLAYLAYVLGEPYLERRYFRNFLLTRALMAAVGVLAMELAIYLLPKTDLNLTYSSRVKYQSGRAVESGGGEAIFLFAFQNLQIVFGSSRSSVGKNA